ncbi:MAG TPA: malonyl-[acyl-carrier protein] O-methyltransferase BioC [Gammaproteobacteria bacterium]|jgi:malonyl-CoA O-methyltransferase|nr:malonyl-[acyl-carrier protein] O-methyltransferase BioC [Acidiferrobacteraceae bacterium]MDP6397883.1 methyltransferase domain-containing protein [Arenicellales bacterium]HCX86392.1 malonyl-[acyl-carrier protein] O-methyltransferase BioC [Gammaproteobacteria bacterium]MDP6550891.1 methyltransferase domain-containing protein [Arenicellales bacterium]MDP6790733.1 methyltransferase domain-containing protein [Arenicellales bacterium]|tara:strand:- start:386 stop:1225 length:840 start_codon:yes stop_codon:yes gene_type:complete
MQQAQPRLDARSVMQASHRACRFDPYETILARRSGQELIDRLALLDIVPKHILDLGCGAGIEAGLLAHRYPTARVTGVDLCIASFQAHEPAGTWSAVVGDAAGLPFSADTFDLVFANLVLPWCEPVITLHEIARILKAGGVVVFATSGPDTLKELRNAWSRVDDREHVHRFADMHNVGDALLQAGFSEPVVDVETLSFTYCDLKGLADDLRALGATNAATRRRRTLTGRSRWQAFVEAYQPLKHDQGRLRATFEVVYAVAWAGENALPGQGSVGVDLPQ